MLGGFQGFEVVGIWQRLVHTVHNGLIDQHKVYGERKSVTSLNYNLWYLRKDAKCEINCIFPTLIKDRLGKARDLSWQDRLDGIFKSIHCLPGNVLTCISDIR